jgi:sialate O-acetylesterase
VVPRRLRAARAAGLVALLAWLVPASPAQAAAPEASTDASPRFADVFGSGMVLPHGQPLELRGRAAPRESLTLRVAGRSYPLPAGGPYRIELRDTRGAGATLEDVLAGEVWLCSGQSNMEFPAGRSIDQPDQLMQGHDAIRLLNVAHQTALVPRESFAERPAWQHADADAVRQFSAVCYFFARHPRRH